MLTGESTRLIVTGEGAMGARDYFEGVRRAAESIEGLTSAIRDIESGEPLPTGAGAGVRSTTPSDPTAAAAFKRGEVLADLKAERDAALETVGEALQVIEGLRRCFSRKAEVIELHYIDGLGWGDVGAAIGVDRRTALRWRDELCAWLDANPRAYVLGCRFVDTK